MKATPGGEGLPAGSQGVRQWHKHYSNYDTNAKKQGTEKTSFWRNRKLH